MCVERGFRILSQVGDKREEDEKPSRRRLFLSLQKENFALLFFRSRIVLFFALPFDFVSPLIS